MGTKFYANIVFGLNLWIFADKWLSEKVFWNLSSFTRSIDIFYVLIGASRQALELKITLCKRKFCSIWTKRNLNALCVKLSCWEKFYTGCRLLAKKFSFFLFLIPSAKKWTTEIWQKSLRNRTKLLFAPQKNSFFRQYFWSCWKTKNINLPSAQWREH